MIENEREREREGRIHAKMKEGGLASINCVE